MVRSVKDIKTEEVKKIFSPEDFEKWLKFEDKGRRLGEIVNNPKMRGIQSDATRGMQKLHREKQRLLKKYNIFCK